MMSLRGALTMPLVRSCGSCIAGAGQTILRSILVLVLILCTATPIFAQASSVVGVDWSKYAGMTGVQPGDTFGQDITTVLQNQSRYLYQWIDSNYSVTNYQAFGGARGYYPPFSEGYEASIRPLAQFAWSNAVMLETGIYNPAVTGLSQSDALNKTEMAIRGVAMTYETNRTSGGSTWGEGLTHNQSWQSAYWASQDAEAAWMLWGQISDSTKQAVASMVKNEADSYINYTVPYWKSPTGVTNYPGDTKAEENAWNSRILTVAQAMMPNDPNVGAWRAKASELMVSSYSRQSDLTNTTVIDGKQVQQWLHGYNSFNDGVVVNHNIAHPGYMTAHTLTYSTIVDSSLAGQTVPQSAEFNAQLTWDGITKLNFVPGTNPYGTGVVQQPGGTSYHLTNGLPNPEPYFPNGEDWAANPSIDVDYVLFDVYSSIMHLDAGQATTAMDWANAQVNALRNFQLRSGHDGNLYQAGDWVSASDELEVSTYQDLSEAWLVWWLNQHNQIAPVSSGWSSVPEPSTASLLGVAALTCLMCFGVRRRVRQNADVRNLAGGIN